MIHNCSSCGTVIFVQLKNTDNGMIKEVDIIEARQTVVGGLIIPMEAWCPNCLIKYDTYRLFAKIDW